MASKAFKAIAEGLGDAIAYAKGDKARGKAHRVRIQDVDVRRVRSKLNMSQEDFAIAFGVSVGTVRNWEQGRRKPEGPARVLLTVIDREPKAVLRAMASA